MTPAARFWREERIAEWRNRAAQIQFINAARYADDVTAWDQTADLRASCLISICDRLQAELDAAPIEATPAPPARASAFGGTARDRHLDSARVCRAVGAPTAAAVFERLAGQSTESGTAAPSRCTVTNCPPPDAIPFVAGPQIEFFA